MSTDRIEKQILLRAPLSKVWRALSDSQQFGQWFGMRFEEPFAPGRRMKGVIVPTTVDPEVAKHQKPYENTPFDITIDRIEPERIFSFRWHPGAIDPAVDYSKEPTTLIVFTLEQQADGVLLTVTESGFDQIPLARRAKVFAMNEQGWTMQMRLIKGYLAHAT
jgi:uncharacterized protein YndB with AHSA1/START domain